MLVENLTRFLVSLSTNRSYKRYFSFLYQLIRQTPRTVLKKTKQSVLKSTRRSRKLEQIELPKDVQEIGGEYEKARNVVDETLTRDISRKQDEENSRGNSSGNTRVPMKLRAMKTREEEDNQVPKDVSLKQLREGGVESQETLDKIEERDFSNSKVNMQQRTFFFL